MLLLTCRDKILVYRNMIFLSKPSTNVTSQDYCLTRDCLTRDRLTRNHLLPSKRVQCSLLLLTCRDKILVYRNMIFLSKPSTNVTSQDYCLTRDCLTRDRLTRNHLLPSKGVQCSLLLLTCRDKILVYRNMISLLSPI